MALQVKKSEFHTVPQAQVQAGIVLARVGVALYILAHVALFGLIFR